MKSPDKIHLQVCGDCPKVDCKNCKFEDLEDNVTWCKDRIFDQDVEYIRKDALLEKLNRARELRIKAGAKESSDGIRVIDALTNLINGL